MMMFVLQCVHCRHSVIAVTFRYANSKPHFILQNECGFERPSFSTIKNHRNVHIVSSILYMISKTLRT